jgi:hypothetical protein
VVLNGLPSILHWKFFGHLTTHTKLI